MEKEVMVNNEIDSKSRCFETLEDLLSSHSPMYSKQRTVELIARLSQLTGRST